MFTLNKNEYQTTTDEGMFTSFQYPASIYNCKYCPPDSLLDDLITMIDNLQWDNFEPMTLFCWNIHHLNL